MKYFIVDKKKNYKYQYLKTSQHLPQKYMQIVL